MENFEIYVIFGVILRRFQTEHCNYLFIKDYLKRAVSCARKQVLAQRRHCERKRKYVTGRATNFFLLDSLKHSNPRNLTKLSLKA